MYSELQLAINAVYKELNLENIPNQTLKIQQFYESLKQRMGVVLVGPSGSGKSTIWKVFSFLRFCKKPTKSLESLFEFKPSTQNLFQESSC